MEPKYSILCGHYMNKRINDNFVKCTECGEIIVNQKNIVSNKSQKNFVNENKNYTKNFDRNFSNLIKSEDNIVDDTNLYYTNRDRTIFFTINPTPITKNSRNIYEIRINGACYYLTNEQIEKILIKYGAIKIEN